MEQLPGPVLWIGLVEVSEKRSVREVLKTRSVVGHHVSRAREVEACVAVPVEALMGAREEAEVGGRTVIGDGSFR